MRRPIVSDPAIPTVDARGHRCPAPTLRLRRALEVMQTGERVLILADDPLARIDIPHFARANGHEVSDMAVEGDVIRVTVRKGVRLLQRF